MSPAPPRPAPLPGAVRRVGTLAGAGSALVTAAYAAVLVAGFLSLTAPDEPIGDPWFTAMELLILLLAPLLVALMAAVRAAASPEVEIFGLLAVVFMGIVAALTSAVHFVILVAGHDPAFTALPWAPSLLAFRWPSVAYAVDVLAWDLFFPLSVLCAAAIFRGAGLERWIRAGLVAAGLLALAGLGGALTADMGWRNVGIVGYAGLFPVAALLMAAWFRRAGGAAPRGAAPP